MGESFSALAYLVVIPVGARAPGPQLGHTSSAFGRGGGREGVAWHEDMAAP